MQKKVKCTICRSKFVPSAYALSNYARSKTIFCSENCRKEMRRRRCREWRSANPDSYRRSWELANAKASAKRDSLRSPTAECGECGRRFLPSHGHRVAMGLKRKVYCRSECRNLANRRWRKGYQDRNKQRLNAYARVRRSARRLKVQCNCGFCGRTFTALGASAAHAKRGHKAYCTKRCRQKALAEFRKQWLAERPEVRRADNAKRRTAQRIGKAFRESINRQAELGKVLPKE